MPPFGGKICIGNRSRDLHVPFVINVLNCSQNCTRLKARSILRTFKSSRVPLNCELYEKVIVYSTKLRSTNQNAVTVSFVYINTDPFVSTSETTETLRSNVGDLRKTSVEPRKASKLFGPTSEIFGRLRINLGNLR